MLMIAVVFLALAWAALVAACDLLFSKTAGAALKVTLAPLFLGMAMLTVLASLFSFGRYIDQDILWSIIEKGVN